MKVAKDKKWLTAKWRKCGWGRLYWRSANQRSRVWDSGDIAKLIDGAVRTHFKSVGALMDELTELNCGEK